LTSAFEGVGLRRSNTGSPLEVLLIFLKLGLTSFGGPVAHLGYFRREFVVRRAWLDDRAYADLVALCQFLPGPASSQTGFALGLVRAGYLGGLAAWAGFTLPSAAAMTLFAYGVGALKGPVGDGLLHGLKLVAVAIVAQAVIGMAQTLCPDRARATIAVLSLILMAFAPAAWAQIAIILLGALAGLIVCRQGGDVAGAAAEAPISRRMGIVFAGLYVVLLALSFVPAGASVAALVAAFYRSGAGRRQRLSVWLRRRPGRAGAAVYFCRLPRRGRQRCAGRRRRGGAGVGRDLHSRTLAADGGLGLLAGFARPRQRACGDGRRQCGRGRPAGFRAL
jgi:chromate transporter